MELLQGLLAWLSEPERWQGPDSIPVRLGEHVLLSGLPVLVAIALAVPIGLAIGHTGRFRLLVVTLANIGRALPTFALLVIFLPIVLRLGLGRYIVDGLALRQDARIIVGAVLVAVLALVADRLLGMVERGVGPRQDSAGVIKEQLARPA